MTRTKAGSLRGMHYHLRQADLCYVSQGRVYMALVDLRAGQAKDEFRLDENESVLIPPRVAHGYLAETDATMTYLLTEEVDGSDEFGFRFDDPKAAIGWPMPSPVISARDRDAGDLTSALAAVRTAGAERR